MSESENTGGNTTELNSRITELTAMKEKIIGAESLEDLRTVMTSSQGISGMEDLMRQGEQWGRRPMDHSPNQDNSNC